MNGFLNSIHHSDPPSSLIEPLRPRLWRSNELRLHAAITSWGAKFEGPLSDGWGYPLDGNWKSPYQNMAAWESFVRKIANLSRGKEIYWDIWNEPDTLGSWLGPREALFSVWIRAAQILKQELGQQTRVGGPSISSFQPDYLEAFLSRCAAAGCPVDFLCWHELEPWSDIAIVEKNLLYARLNFVENRRFKELGLKELHVNEYVGEVDQYRAAELLAFLYYLERGGADYASRSCWGLHCEDNSIDGIIDPSTRQPRAPWWVHAFYAAGCDARVRCDSDFPHVVAVAQRPAPGPHSAHVLVGYYGHEGATADRVQVDLRLSGLTGIVNRPEAAVRVMRIPSVGPRPLPLLPQEEARTVEQSAERLSVTLTVGLHEVCAVRIDPR